MDPSLATDIGPHMRLERPTMLASGILGISLDVFNRLYRAGGVGAVVTKSLSREPWEGYHSPVLASVGGGGWINAVGLSNPGAERFAAMIMPNRDVPVIVSLVGSAPGDFEEMIRRFAGCRVDAYELNLSCPHVAKVGLEVGDDPGLVRRIVAAAKEAAGAGGGGGADTPVIAKVGLGSTNYLDTVGAAVDSGADAVTAINTVRAMAIDAETQRPILSNGIGGLSGTPIKPIALRCVYEISSRYDVPVIGCGGISTWQDAVEFILAGASAVQVGSAVGNGGGSGGGNGGGNDGGDDRDGWIGVFGEICDGIAGYMRRKGIASIREMRGLAAEGS